MKPKKVIMVGGQSGSTASNTVTNAQPQADPQDKKRRFRIPAPLVKQMDFWGLLRAVIAFIIGAGAYYISLAILPADNMWKWVAFICAALMALLILWIFDRTQPEKTPFREAVVIAVALVFFYDMATTYFTKPETESVNNKEDNQLHGQVLETGRVVYVLQPGEETKWLGFPEDGGYHYDISSSDYNHDIIFTDGSVYPGGEKTVIPKKQHQYLKVRAKNTQQIVTIVVTKN